MSKFQQRLTALKTVGASEDLIDQVLPYEDVLTASVAPAIFWGAAGEFSDYPENHLALEWFKGGSDTFVSLVLMDDGNIEVYIQRSIHDTETHENLTLEDAVTLVTVTLA